MTHAGRKDGTDISGAEVLCSRISAAYKDDTSKSHCLYLNRRQILAIKKKNDWSGTCWHTHTVWVQRPGCKSAPGTLPHSSCRCCQMQQKSQKYNLPKKKKKRQGCKRFAAPLPFVRTKPRECFCGSCTESAEFENSAKAESPLHLAHLLRHLPHLPPAPGDLSQIRDGEVNKSKPCRTL